MFTRFLMDLSGIFLRSLEKQPFSLIFSVAGLVALGWWNWQQQNYATAQQERTETRILELTQSIADCNEARTQLSIRVATLETLQKARKR